MGLFDRLFGGKKPSAPASIAVSAEKGAVYAPVAGKVEPMESLPDPVFSSGAMGPCLGVWPTDGNVFSPVSGTVTAAMPHAFGLLGDDGVEVLIHVGVDTVEMKGDGFTVHVKKDAHVAAGDPLLTFDRHKVATAGHPDVVMTIITNADDLASVEVVGSGDVAVGSKLFQTA